MSRTLCVGLFHMTGWEDGPEHPAEQDTESSSAGPPDRNKRQENMNKDFKKGGKQQQQQQQFPSPWKYFGLNEEEK